MSDRTRLFADPRDVCIHDNLLIACSHYGNRVAIVDLSERDHRSLTYARYSELVNDVAVGFIREGLTRGDRVAIYLPNCWEFAVATHAATLAGGIPTFLNPSYRQREVYYQLADTGAAFLITDSNLIEAVNLNDLPLRRVFLARGLARGGAKAFEELLSGRGTQLPELDDAPTTEIIAALPYSSGTTGMPKGVMLTHSNLVSNVYQVLGFGASPYVDGEVTLCFLPLCHIYGLNFLLNPTLTIGGTLILTQRFEMNEALQIISNYGVSFLPLVPSLANAFSDTARQGLMPRAHKIRWALSAASPLASDIASAFQETTGIPLVQAYGMTETSPATHMGFQHGDLSRPDSIGKPLALTECRLVDEEGREAKPGERGELVIRGPQVMAGYWNAPDDSASALRPLNGSDELWYWSGDIARRDELGLYYIVGRAKEMIKYKGFPIAPVEIESVLLEHPAIADCGVVGRADPEAGEVPCGCVVLRSDAANPPSEDEIRKFVADRLAHYKQLKCVRIVESIPRNPSGKILRRRLREMF
jgi:long-chain acyl-CoA synthetase